LRKIDSLQVLDLGVNYYDILSLSHSNGILIRRKMEGEFNGCHICVVKRLNAKPEALKLIIKKSS
jgi:hypothetical protein